MATIDQRKTRDGRTRYRVRIRRRGVTETATFATASEARVWARDVEQALYSGSWNRRGREGGLTFSLVLDRYLDDRDLSEDVQRQLEWWRRQLGSEMATSISRRQVFDLRRELSEEDNRAGRTRSSATVNRYMAALSGLFSWALKQQYLEAHPVQGVPPLQEGSARLRCLTSSERRALIAACRQTGGLRLQALVVLGLSTGARRGELLKLRWSDLDVGQRELLIHGGGGLRTRKLPLPVSAMALLGQLAKVRRIDGNSIFADAHGEVRFPRAAWQAALKRAEIEDFRFQDLRHTAAACLAQNGASLAEIADVLGARTLQTVRRYASLAETRAPAAISRMHEELFET